MANCDIKGEIVRTRHIAPTKPDMVGDTPFSWKIRLARTKSPPLFDPM
jgi:hypothetical protein